MLQWKPVDAFEKSLLFFTFRCLAVSMSISGTFCWVTILCRKVWPLQPVWRYTEWRCLFGFVLAECCLNAGYSVFHSPMLQRRAVDYKMFHKIVDTANLTWNSETASSGHIIRESSVPCAVKRGLCTWSLLDGSSPQRSTIELIFLLKLIWSRSQELNQSSPINLLIHISISRRLCLPRSVIPTIPRDTHIKVMSVSGSSRVRWIHCIKDICLLGIWWLPMY